MERYLAHLLLTALLLMVVAHFVRGVMVKSFGHALLGAFVLGIINAILWPIATLLTFPLIIITLGIFLFFLNAFLFWLLGALVPGIRIESYSSAFLGSLLLLILNGLIEWMLR